MQDTATWIFLALMLALASTAHARCVAIDGDTLVCDRQKIRLTNVYAAELTEPGGTAAKRRLQAIVRGGEVNIRPHGRDRYGRILAEVYVNGRRIEQSDIGPRAGAGSQWSIDRQYVVKPGARTVRRPR